MCKTDREGLSACGAAARRGAEVRSGCREGRRSGELARRLEILLGQVLGGVFRAPALPPVGRWEKGSSFSKLREETLDLIQGVCACFVAGSWAEMTHTCRLRCPKCI